MEERVKEPENFYKDKFYDEQISTGQESTKKHSTILKILQKDKFLLKELKNSEDIFLPNKEVFPNKQGYFSPFPLQGVFSSTTSDKLLPPTEKEHNDRIVSWPS